MTGKFLRPMMVVAVAMTALAGAPAMAATGDVLTASIDPSAFDLSSDSGRQGLKRHVNARINAMCSDLYQGGPEAVVGYTGCRDEARWQVAAQMKRILAERGTTIASAR